MSLNHLFSWGESITQTYQTFIQKMINFLPNFLGAIVFLGIGWLVAHLFRSITKKLIIGLDSLFKKIIKSDGLQKEKLKQSYALIISRLVFWTIILFFIAATTNMLGWHMFSHWMDSIIRQLPNLITGLLIILAGFLLGNGVRSTILSTKSSISNQQIEILARIAQVVIVFTIIAIGVEQIGINVLFLTNILIVILGILLFGGALAFGLGAKTLVENVVGSQYIRKNCRIGEKIKIGDIEGVIIEITQTAIVIDNPSGRTLVPAKLFHEVISSFSINS